MLFTGPSTGGFLKKTILFSGFKILTKKSAKLYYIYEYHFVERKNESRKPDKNSRLRRF
jgi:hypothetical protein